MPSETYSMSAAENLLHAFPEAFPGETLEQRILRQQAYNCCWSAISQNLEVLPKCSSFGSSFLVKQLSKGFC